MTDDSKRRGAEWERLVHLARAYTECDPEPPHDLEFPRRRADLQEAVDAWARTRKGAR